MNHEIYGGIYSQMVFGESFQEPPPSLQRVTTHAAATRETPQISRMWRAVQSGTAKGRFAIVSEQPFTGTQSQQLSFDSGEGQWGVENQGLNRWGMNFVAGKPYEGYVWARAEKPATLFAALESRDGSRVYAETALTVGPPVAADRLCAHAHCRRLPRAFAPKLKQPGSVVLGHAFLKRANGAASRVCRCDATLPRR